MRVEYKNFECKSPKGYWNEGFYQIARVDDRGTLGIFTYPSQRLFDLGYCSGGLQLASAGFRSMKAAVKSLQCEFGIITEIIDE